MIKKHTINIANKHYSENFINEICGKGYVVEKLIMGGIFIKFRKRREDEKELTYKLIPIGDDFTLGSQEFIKKSKGINQVQLVKSYIEQSDWNYVGNTLDCFIISTEKENDVADFYISETEEKILSVGAVSRDLKMLYIR